MLFFALLEIFLEYRGSYKESSLKSNEFQVKGFLLHGAQVKLVNLKRSVEFC